MSSTPATTDDVDGDGPSVRPPEHYATRAKRGDETWLEDAIEDYLGLTVTAAQQRICRALVNNEKVVVVTANGLGKSYILAAIVNVWLLTKYPAIAFGTSGTYAKLKRTFCKPIEALHDNALEGVGLPGTYKQQPPRIEIDGEPEHYFEAASPEDAGELEGVHTAYTLGIIEEADKKAIDKDVLDAMTSLVTDHRDRLIAISNPPVDSTNVVADLMDDPTWETVQLSSFESHNVQVETGEADGPLIDGLATLGKIRDDWESFNDEPWPGIEQARTAHERQKGLDTRWYRRRAGVIPPDTASAYRPYKANTAKQAYTDPAATNYFGSADTTNRPLGTGIDVAGPGSDRTVAITYFRNGDFEVRYTTQDADYPAQETALMHDSRLGGDRYHPVAVDASGEGSGLASYLDDRLPDVHRFGSDKKPLTEGTDDDNPYGLVNYASQRAEALAALGDVLPDATYIDTDLREELVIGGRTIEYGTKTIDSRGEHGAEVVTVNSKEKVEERLGRSPDFLDAAAQAVWAAECTDGGFDPDDAIVF
ncbi:hypothetical protein ACFQMF_01450 [Halorubrum rutilum]|uniref:Uncharacterized protein n=1 Tax=Halorubrum rutilum TaxID=1364933 RepID=A0ABD6AHA8_9EURY|nr:hypothetical protein [Halorubrum rutilum]